MDLFSESKKWTKNILKIFLITYSSAPLRSTVSCTCCQGFAILIICPFTAQTAQWDPTVRSVQCVFGQVEEDSNRIFPTVRGDTEGCFSPRIMLRTTTHVLLLFLKACLMGIDPGNCSVYWTQSLAVPWRVQEKIYVFFFFKFGYLRHLFFTGFMDRKNSSNFFFWDNFSYSPGNMDRFWQQKNSPRVTFTKA